jgi:endogenous inhibitor of DNA gyrase (YacG/DUF329 family)
MAARLKCPICRAEVVWEKNPHRPFCSERCQLIDLGAWVDERYRVRGRKADRPVGKRDDEADSD